jgi:hypothetical protein
MPGGEYRACADMPYGAYRGDGRAGEASDWPDADEVDAVRGRVGEDCACDVERRRTLMGGGLGRPARVGEAGRGGASTDGMVPAAKGIGRLQMAVG